jgi:colanic acid biosynthesis glycosyl transferase WcaI
LGATLRILLINQFFWPDLAATSQLLTDLARHLHTQGHDVTVICARNSYAGEDCTEKPPVKVIRVRDRAFQRGPLARPLSYLSFLFLSAWVACRSGKPDIVITMTTPPLLGVVGLLVQTLRGARHYIWEMDLYPDAAVDLCVLREKSLATRTIGFIADCARKRSSAVIVLGECMRKRVISRGIPPALVEVAENWSDGSLFHPAEKRSGGDLTIVYPGNLGLAHDTGTLAAAMRDLKSNPGIRFLFVGGGQRSESLQQFCKTEEISAASFLPYCSRDRLNGYLSNCDIGLVTQRDCSLGSLVPSKVYSLMAVGLPVLYIGPAASTVAEMIRRFQCGWELRCGDSRQLVLLLQRLLRNRELIQEAGARSRQAFLDHYDKSAGVERVCNVIGLTRAASKA